MNVAGMSTSHSRFADAPLTSSQTSSKRHHPLNNFRLPNSTVIGALRLALDHLVGGGDIFLLYLPVRFLRVARSSVCTEAQDGGVYASTRGRS